MNEAAQTILGQHDFIALRSSNCEAKTTKRTISDISVNRNKKLIKLEVAANAFLHHMVRNIVGILLEIGEEKKPVACMQEVVEGRDRKLGGVTAPAEGLYLISVKYPEEFGINNEIIAPFIAQFYYLNFTA